MYQCFTSTTGCVTEEVSVTTRNDRLSGPAARFDAGVREGEPVLVDDDSRRRAVAIGARFPDMEVLRRSTARNSSASSVSAGVENCIEQLGQGVLDHSVVFSDTLGRAKRTAPPLMKTVYSDDPHEWGRKVRDFHKPIKGTISDGSRYHALNPELFYWAHATFVDQVIYNTDTFIRRLSDAEKEQIFNEGKIWYGLYGVSDRGQPQTYDEFVAYWDDMLERFVPHKTVLYGTGYIRKGIPAPRRMPKPNLADRIRTAERLYPPGPRRNPAAADARRVRAGVGCQAGESFPAVRRGHAGVESGDQPATVVGWSTRIGRPGHGTAPASTRAGSITRHNSS